MFHDPFISFDNIKVRNAGLLTTWKIKKFKKSNVPTVQ